MNIDRSLLSSLRVEINDALRAIAAKHNLVIEVGNASFTPQNATFKLKIATKGENGETLSQERSDWIKFAELYNLDPSKLDAVITVGGEQYKVLGLLFKSKAYPVLVQSLRTGKRVKLSRCSAVLLPGTH